MKIYYYIDTGHRIGLDRLRRSSPVIRAMQDMDIDVTMLTNDFRAGEYAKEEYGIRRYVSVDVVRNIANIATPSDRLVFDSDDISAHLLEDMIGYFGRIVRISNLPEAVGHDGELLVSSPSADIVDPKYFSKKEHRLGDIYFWGDDDYDMKLLENVDAFAGRDIALLEGYYFFMQYANELQGKFSSLFESETYEETLKGAKRFVTSSPQSALEALAAGSSPVYVKKESAPDFFSDRMRGYGIPVAETFERGAIDMALSEKPEYKTGRLDPDAASKTARSIVDFFDS